jgi:hypothetical protein
MMAWDDALSGLTFKTVTNWTHHRSRSKDASNSIGHGSGEPDSDVLFRHEWLALTGSVFNTLQTVQ